MARAAAVHTLNLVEDPAQQDKAMLVVADILEVLRIILVAAVAEQEPWVRQEPQGLRVMVVLALLVQYQGQAFIMLAAVVALPKVVELVARAELAVAVQDLQQLVPTMEQLVQPILAVVEELGVMVQAEIIQQVMVLPAARVL